MTGIPGDLIQRQPDGSYVVYPLSAAGGYMGPLMGQYAGYTDDIGINQALTLAGSGLVRLVPGTYTISSPLVIASDGAALRGAGRASVIKASSGFSGTAMVHATAPATGYRYDIHLSGMLLNTDASGTTAVQFDSTYYATIDQVDIEGVYTTSIYLNGTSSYFGAYTRIRDCHLGNAPSGSGSGGVGITSSNHEHWSVEGCTINWFNQSGGVGVNVANSSVRLIDNDFDECDTSVLLAFCRDAVVMGNDLDRGISQFITMEACLRCYIGGNNFGSHAGSLSTDYMINAAVNTGREQNIMTGNRVLLKSGSSVPWAGVLDEQSAATIPDLYVSNDFGDYSLGTRNNAVLRGNHGYNPVGNIAAPAIPASGASYTNALGADCTVFVTGGTVTAVAIGGTSTGATSGGFRVPAGQTITLTYSVAPTWTWFGD